jgi:hypothetical protein
MNDEPDVALTIKHETLSLKLTQALSVGARKVHSHEILKEKSCLLETALDQELTSKLIVERQKQIKMPVK